MPHGNLRFAARLTQWEVSLTILLFTPEHSGLLLYGMLADDTAMQMAGKLQMVT